MNKIKDKAIDAGKQLIIVLSAWALLIGIGMAAAAFILWME